MANCGGDRMGSERIRGRRKAGDLEMRGEREGEVRKGRPREAVGEARSKGKGSEGRVAGQRARAPSGDASVRNPRGDCPGASRCRHCSPSLTECNQDNDNHISR